MAAIFKEWEMLQERHVGPMARFVFVALANRRMIKGYWPIQRVG
jgi:hypothetical protein